MAASKIDLFLMAGEPSGDLQGARLIEALLKQNPQLRIAAVAGPKMRAFPIQCVEPMESLQVMGFIDVAKAFPKIARLFYSIRKQILTLQPKAFIGIDYPGFNLRMHRSLKTQGFTGKRVHYICPSVWAWGKKRIPFMAKHLDLLLTLLPFEPACFAHTSLPVHYVGHPLTEPIAAFASDSTFRARHNIASTAKILALFPGSRSQEVERNLPLMLKTASTLQAQDPTLHIAISSPQPIATHHTLISPDENYNLMSTAHLALAKSGTVTLELALHRTPTVIQFAIKPLDVFLATKIFRINLPFYGLPNLIRQKQVFPELFGPKLTEQSARAEAEKLWFQEEARNQCVKECDGLWKKVGNKPAAQTAATQILQIISNI